MNKIIKPFLGYRYSDAFREKISENICPPYDVIDEKLQMELFKNPYNYVRIVLSPYGHDSALESLKKFISEKVIIRENKPKIYILEQKFRLGENEGKSVGIIALVSKDAKILIHEQTKPKVIEDRIELLEKTGFNTCSIMLFAKNTNIKERAESMNKEKIFEFSYISEDLGVKIEGNFYSSEDFSILQELEKTYFFIADGHHRFRAAKTVYEKKGEEYLMAYITDKNSGMLIFPIAREIKKQNNKVMEQIQKFSRDFRKIDTIQNIGQLIEILREGDFDFLLVSQSGIFKVNLSKNPEENVINFIHNYIFEGNNLDISFEHNIFKSLENMRRREIECSIIPKAMSVDSIWEVVENGKILPPKSTYFWPKIPSGLVLNRTNFSKI